MTTHGRYRGVSSRRAKLRYLHGPMTVDATPTHRRIQALSALGWSTAEVSRAMGQSRTYATSILRRPTIHRDTAAVVAAAYTLLVDRIPPPTRGTRYTLTLAEKRGWLAPVMWDDIDDIDEVPSPAPYVRTRLSKADLAAEYRHLRSFGLTDERIAEQLGVKLATVGDWRRAG